MGNPEMETAVILAAGMGTRLRTVIGESPKGCLKIGDQMLLERSILLLKEQGVENIILVKGYEGAQLEKEINDLFPDVRFVENELYAETGSMHSLYLASDLIRTDFFLLESDLLYERRSLQVLNKCTYKDAILVSGKTGSGDEVFIYGENERISLITKDFFPNLNLLGELVGIQKVSLRLYRELCHGYRKSDPFPVNNHYEEVISQVSQEKPVRIVHVEDLAWTEIDDPSHYRRAVNTIYPRILQNDEKYYDEAKYST
ncbi:MAG: phosphocholine cytidylyltransferase family protein [Proteobacteria bacterium]|nr:phosphocholine cytidylyltransferase family protein [Pseudomonadota bacterium]